MAPDTIEPLKDYSVQEFTEEAILLKERRPGDNDQDPLIRFISFALTGLHPDDGTRAVINALQNRMDDLEIDLLRALRDLDSLNGITQNLPFILNSLAVYPVPRFDDTLKRSCHLTADILVPGSVSTLFSDYLRYYYQRSLSSGSFRIPIPLSKLHSIRSPIVVSASLTNAVLRGYSSQSCTAKNLATVSLRSRRNNSRTSMISVSFLRSSSSFLRKPAIGQPLIKLRLSGYSVTIQAEAWLLEPKKCRVI